MNGCFRQFLCHIQFEHNRSDLVTDQIFVVFFECIAQDQHRFCNLIFPQDHRFCHRCDGKSPDIIFRLYHLCDRHCTVTVTICFYYSNHFGFRVDRFVHDPKIFCNGIHVDLGTDTAVFTAHHVSSPSCIVFCNRCFRYLHLFLSSASARTRISPSTRSFAVILRFPYFCAAA